MYDRMALRARFLSTDDELFTRSTCQLRAVGHRASPVDRRRRLKERLL